MNIKLCKMTKDRFHSFFKALQPDPDTWVGPEENPVYRYNEKSVDAYIAKHTERGTIHFAVMLEQNVIGDLYFKDIDLENKSCGMSIHLINDSVKNQGYGTCAERLAVTYAFEKMKLQIIYADTLIKNKRSQHVLRKVGFQEISADKTRIYFQCVRSG